MGLFTPIYLKSNLPQKKKDKAYAKIEKITKPEKLKAIVMAASDPDLRDTAFRKLDSQSKIQIARTAPDPKVRIAAIEYRYFPDPGVILQISQEDADQSVRENALRRLKKIILSEKPQDAQTMRSFGDLLLRTFEVLGDPAFLAKVGGNASCNLARYEAIRRMEDRAALAEIGCQFLWVAPRDSVSLERIGRRDACIPPYEAAINRLVELDGEKAIPQLADIILRSDDKTVHKTALEKLRETFGNQAMPVLAEIVRRSADYDIRMQAVQWLAESGDDELLVRVAMAGTVPKGDNSFNFYQALHKAVLAIRSQHRLGDLAKNAPTTYVRSEAVSHLENQEILSEIARTEPDEHVRAEAVFRLEDQKLLAEIARTDPGKGVRSCAAARLTDGSVLVRILQEDPEPIVRKEAAGNICLTDPDVLARAARADKDPEVRASAVLNPNLTELKALEDAAIQDSADQVRTCAVNRISGAEILSRVAAAGGRRKGDAQGWLAAVKLSRIAPKKAVEPLVALMRADRETSFVNDILKWSAVPESEHPPIHFERTTMATLRMEAADFLIRQYTETKDPEIKALIRTLPDGEYGSNEKRDGWTEDGRENQVIRFRLPSRS